MAIVYRDAMVWVNNVDLSDQVSELTLNLGSESLDDTAMGDDTRKAKGGLKTWSIGMKFHQNFDAAKVDATLDPLVGTTTCIEIRPVNTCTTAVNPSRSGIASLMGYNPQVGAVGSLLDVDADFQAHGTLTRSTTAS